MARRKQSDFDAYFQRHCLLDDISRLFAGDETALTPDIDGVVYAVVAGRAALRWIREGGLQDDEEVTVSILRRVSSGPNDGELLVRWGDAFRAYHPHQLPERGRLDVETDLTVRGIIGQTVFSREAADEAIADLTQDLGAGAYSQTQVTPIDELLGAQVEAFLADESSN